MELTGDLKKKVEAAETKEAVREAIARAGMELDDDELDAVSGGKISFVKRPEKPGWTQHKVAPCDTLIRIADKYGIKDWRKIREWNPHISHKTNMLRTGEWLWIKQ